MTIYELEQHVLDSSLPRPQWFVLNHTVRHYNWQRKDDWPRNEGYSLSVYDDHGTDSPSKPLFSKRDCTVDELKTAFDKWRNDQPDRAGVRSCDFASCEL